LRRIIQSKPRLAIGVKVALTVLAHCKPGVAGGTVDPISKTSSNSRSKKVSTERFAEDIIEGINSSGKSAIRKAKSAWGNLVFAASTETRTGTPMSYDEVRLWLQSYNAGPYACLKYKGDVPYKETRNYVPKIMKFYQQDLSDTKYDSIIVEKATKYGLDPQLIRAVMKAESDFNKKTVSHAGARGLMQVMPVVWADVKKRYQFKWDYDSNVFDPDKNVEVACAYLAWLRYDFLPRHFEEFPANPEAPAIVKRDKKRMPTERISARDQIMITQRANQKKIASSPGA